MTSVTQTQLTSSTPHFSSSNLRFIYVKNTSDYWEVVKKAFETIETFYGNTTQALQKIADKKRNCELLLDFDRNISLGFIVYKTKNRNFLIKTLFNLHSEQENIANLLLNRIIKLATRSSSRSILCKVSSKDSELLRFFKSRNFTIHKSSNNKSLPNIKTHTLIRKISSQSSNKKTSSKEKKTDSSFHKRKRSSEKNHSSFSHHKLSKKRREDDFEYKKDMNRQDYVILKKHKKDMNQQTRSSSTQRSITSSRINTPLHQMTLRKKYIHQIKSRKKTIEGRINSGVFLRYKKGDTIRFFYQQDPSDDVICEIEAIREYPSFAEMLQKEDYKKCITDAHSLESAIRTYDQIPTYRERAAKSGVIAIQLKVCER
jgi:ASC-1-like (ASCH) protein